MELEDLESGRKYEFTYDGLNYDKEQKRLVRGMRVAVARFAERDPADNPEGSDQVILDFRPIREDRYLISSRRMWMIRQTNDPISLPKPVE